MKKKKQLKELTQIILLISHSNSAHEIQQEFNKIFSLYLRPYGKTCSSGPICNR